ncbi:inner membrane protein [Kosakonia oryzendophytica]|uniref:Inner membrane protein n=1 Tax=Kosakonia oryzendophytica TaxID=1005665 RepID=A0A1C4A4T3_9ENTR|nr:cell envelope integrity protein CreD [Kosakonia oryzendophytica]TDT52277.1 inner membrane protein [Enterobacter sp. AG5470]SCB89522.1 inner membrane protein [Kosakonia oryzendophytica]
MLKSPLFWKMLTLAGCFCVLLIPLTMLSSLIGERANYRNDVTDTLRQSSAGAQKLIGPLIAVPVTETVISMESAGDKDAPKEVRRKHSYIRMWLPESLMVNGTQQVETRKIGIYDGQIWHNEIDIKAEFDPKRLDIKPGENITLGEPFMVLAVSDARGIGQIHTTRLNGEALSVEPGTGLMSELQGIHMPLAAESVNKPLQLSMSLNLSGTGAFSVVPLGRNSEMTLNSDWPHPGFMGDFLPEKREVSASGFQAHWQSSWFANNLDSKVRDNIRLAASNDWVLPAFSVNIATPADQYQLTDRAVKYAVLLIVLTFLAFFVFESLTARQMHPMQYMLVGLSLVMFYLVLLALSEHTGFTLAWIIASLLGALLNGIYLQGVMRSWRASLLFTAALLLLDGVMWGLLNSEDNALLLGTGVLFVALSTVMFLTRKLDWYRLSTGRKKTNEPVADAEDALRIWK